MTGMRHPGLTDRLGPPSRCAAQYTKRRWKGRAGVARSAPQWIAVFRFNSFVKIGSRGTFSRSPGLNVSGGIGRSAAKKARRNFFQATRS